MKILYRPSWQRLRVSFLAANHPMGGFNTVDGTANNLKRLSNYLADAGFNDDKRVALWTQIENGRFNYDPDTELALRLYRAINLLNATRMGYSGQNKSSTQQDLAVKQYRNSLQPHYDSHTAMLAEDRFINARTGFNGWDVVQYELETMWREDRYWFTAIHKDLAARAYRADRKQKGGKGSTRSIQETRPDLLTFIDICDKINSRTS